VELGEAALLDEGHGVKMAIQRGSPLRSRGQRLGGTPLRTARRSSTTRRSITPRPSLLAPRQTEPVTLERQAPRPSVPSVNPSFSVEKGAGKHLSRGNPLVDVVNENEKNEKNENEKKNDKWSGIHESLKGLTSFIAKIGSPERLRSSRSPEAPVESVWQGPISFAEEMHHVQQKELPAIRPMPVPHQEHQPLSRREESLSDAALDFSPHSDLDHDGHLDHLDHDAPYELTEDRELGEDRQGKVNVKEDWWKERQKRQEENRLEEQKEQQDQRMQQLEREIQQRASRGVYQDSTYDERHKEHQRQEEQRQQEEQQWRREEERRQQEEQRRREEEQRQQEEQQRKEEERRQHEEQQRREEERRREAEAEQRAHEEETQRQAREARERALLEARAESSGPHVQRFQEDEVESSTDDESPQVSMNQSPPRDSPRRLPARAFQRMELTPGTDARTASSDNITMSRTRQSMSSQGEVDELLARLGDEDESTEEGDWI